MVKSFLQFVPAAAFCILLAGCASSPDAAFPDNSPGRGAVMVTSGKPTSCVPFARAHSGIDIRGDAFTWWDQAAGRFRRSSKPSAGAVLVLAGYSSAEHGHVAVVRRIVSAREIRVDHANWLNNGAIHLDDPVADVSPDNDWSQVLVWNIEAHAWGIRTYTVRGFIGPGRDGDKMRVAERDSGEN